MAEFQEVFADGRRHAVFQSDFVGLPLVMQAGLGQGGVVSEAEVEHAHEVEHGLADYGGAAGRAESQNGFAIL